jgi:two-component system copper resistance phosphate regulon response regulator CusR
VRILVIEDDDVIGERLESTLTKEGYTVEWAQDGIEGLSWAKSGAYAVILLDVMMPKMDGWTVIGRLRDAKINTPVLMLTAKDEIDDRVKGLDLGADDYLVKPFDFKELIARVRALTRREKQSKSSVIKISDLEIDTLNKSVRRNGNELHLTPREYSLLEALARNLGRVLSRETIIDRIWDDEESLSNTVNFHVTSLRKKIDLDREKSLIETVHGFGYRINPGGEN